MKRFLTSCLLSFCICTHFLLSQALDISGYKIVQANASSSITLPLGTSIEPGGYVVIARNQSQSAFETAWNTTLGSNVVFINGYTVIGGNGFPTINGSETYTLQNASSVTIDGPTVAESTSGGDNLTRLHVSDASSVEGSWTRSSASIVTNASPGSGMTNTNTGKLIISEFSDASTYNNEFVELFYDVTPIAKGQGSVNVSPTLWKYRCFDNTSVCV